MQTPLKKDVTQLDIEYTYKSSGWQQADQMCK